MENSVGSTLWDMLEKQEEVDFEFHFVDESKKVIEKIGVHRLILVSKSPVFKAMLNGNFKDSSPLVLHDVDPKAFKNLLRLFYDQKCVVYSPEEAFDLYELGTRYDVEGAREIGKTFLLQNIAKENVDVVYMCSSLFEDKELDKRVWEFLEETLVGEVNVSLTGATEKPRNFEVPKYTSPSEVQALEKHIEEIRSLQDINQKVGRTLGLLEDLDKQSKALFNMIIPNNSLMLVSKIEWTPPTSSFTRLNKVYNMINLGNCVSNSFGNRHCHICSSSTQNTDLKPIFNKYNHDDLSKYSVSDMKAVYNMFKGLI